MTTARAFADYPTEAERTPSFECSASTLTGIERSICAHPDLRELDSRMSEAAAAAVFRSSDGVAAGRSQAAWLVRVRDACRSSACLRAAYRKRIAALDAIALPTPGRSSASRVVNDASAAIHDPRIVERLQALASNRCLKAFRLDLGAGPHDIFAEDCEMGMLATNFALFEELAGGVRLIWSGSGDGRPSFEAARSHGLHRMVVTSHGSCCEHSIDFYDYDGSSYRCIAEGENFLHADGKHSFVFGACPPAGEYR